MHFSYYQELLRKYQEGTCSPEEKELLDKWYEELEFHKDVNSVEDDKAHFIRQNWEEMEQLIARSDHKIFRPFLNFRQISRWAAAVVCAGGLGWYIVSHNSNHPADVNHVLAAQQWVVPEAGIKEYRNDGNSNITIRLNDQSRITLHPRSSVKYRHDFGKTERAVHLTGTAFFDIHKNPDMPFYVYTRDIVTKVLGTSFTINANPEARKVTVAVKTGKVSVIALPEITDRKSVTAKQNSEIILTPNQQIIYNETEKQLSLSLVEQPEMITTPEETVTFTFQDTPLSEILKAIENAYGVRIEYDQNLSGNCRLTTSIEDEDLFRKLNVLSSLLGARYEVIDTTIYLTGGGCN